MIYWHIQLNDHQEQAKIYEKNYHWKSTIGETGEEPHDLQSILDMLNLPFTLSAT